MNILISRVILSPISLLFTLHEDDNLVASPSPVDEFKTDEWENQEHFAFMKWNWIKQRNWGIGPWTGAEVRYLINSQHSEQSRKSFSTSGTCKITCTRKEHDEQDGFMSFGVGKEHRSDESLSRGNNSRKAKIYWIHLLFLPRIETDSLTWLWLTE